MAAHRIVGGTVVGRDVVGGVVTGRDVVGGVVVGRVVKIATWLAVS